MMLDAKDVKIGLDGKVYVFNNGIMNTEQQALDNAAKQSSAQANSQGVYVIINPHTGNVLNYKATSKNTKPLWTVP